MESPPLPDRPPFKAYLGNIPYELNEEVVAHFFRGLDVSGDDAGGASAATLTALPAARARAHLCAAGSVALLPRRSLPATLCQLLLHAASRAQRDSVGSCACSRTMRQRAARAAWLLARLATCPA